MATAREIDWTTATVDGGTLSVELNDDAPRGWQGRFKAVAQLLDQAHGRWGAIGISGSVINVKDVAEGVESDLRFFLEGVVQQVNADLGLKDEAEAESEPDEEPSAQQRRQAADHEMSLHFRAFAKPPG
jgi:hypothetical protein